jgi:hypothetical protein
LNVSAVSVVFFYCLREEGRDLKGNTWLVSKRESVIDPALERPLLKLHRAVDVRSFWKAVHRLLSTTIANHSVGLLLQQSTNVPVIAKWTRSTSDDFFAAEPLKRCAMQPRRKKLVRLNDLFRNRSSFLRSSLYRRYLVPQKCAHGVTLFFWKQRRLICIIAILRTVKQGDFSPAEIELLRQLYPQLLGRFAESRRSNASDRSELILKNFSGVCRFRR